MTTSTSAAMIDPPSTRVVIAGGNYFDGREMAVVEAPEHTQADRVEQTPDATHDDSTRDERMIGERVVGTFDIQGTRPGYLSLRIAPTHVADTAGPHVGKAPVQNDKAGPSPLG